MKKLSIERLQEILDEVKESFPRCSKRNIRAEYILDKDNYFYSVKRPSIKIYADEQTVAYFSVDQVTGGLAHELGHLELDGHLRGKARIHDSRRYENSGYYYSLVERAADLEAILKGYGRQFYEFSKVIERRRGKLILPAELTLEEIKFLIGKTR